MSIKNGKSAVAEAILRELKNPFEPRLVKWRLGGGKRQLAYVDARDVMKRLDDVMGPENWQDKYTPVEGGFICELSLFIEGRWITKSNGADNTKVEPIKGGISTALKRAAVEWGVGRYLYYLDPNKFTQFNVESWPKWALPGATESWEDVAELQADASFGMDEDEIVGAAINAAESIRTAETLEELSKIVAGMDSTGQRVLADVIANKTDELTRANG